MEVNGRRRSDGVEPKGEGTMKMNEIGRNDRQTLAREIAMDLR